MAALLIRLPAVIWHIGRNGIFLHLAKVKQLPLAVRILCKLFHRILAKNNDEKLGKALAVALTSLGPGFIKLGQALSTRADLLGVQIAQDLATLQDKVEPFNPEIAKKIVAQELTQPLGEVFQTFDDEPAAAASIAQVHFAKLHNGRNVAVKILRPNIRKKLEADIKFFATIAKIIEFIAPAMKQFKPADAVSQFAHYADIELDLRLEAAAADKLRQNHAKDSGIYIPAVEWLLTTEKILVIERVHGIRIDDPKAIRAKGHDSEAITITAAKCFFFQVFRDGLFHADMHPGNIFIRDDGVLAVIDFGITGHLCVKDRLFLAQLLNAILERDYDKVAQLHRNAKMIGEKTSTHEFAQAIRAAAEPVMGRPMSEISLGRVLGQIFAIAQRHGVIIQPQFTLLQKTMIMAEGIGRQLSPQTNIWPIARKLAADWAEEQTSFTAQASNVKDQLLAFTARLPDYLDAAEKLASQQITPPPTRNNPLWPKITIFGLLIIISGLLAYLIF